MLRSCLPPWMLPVWRWSAILGMRVSTHPGRHGSCEGMKSSSPWHQGLARLQGDAGHDQGEPRSAASEAAPTGGRVVRTDPCSCGGAGDGPVARYFPKKGRVL